MSGCILNKPPRNREFFLFRFFGPELPFLVLLWLWDVKGKAKLCM